MEKTDPLGQEADSEDDRNVLADLTPADLRGLDRTAPGHLDVVREEFVDVQTPPGRK
jgi:hypothetical protein